MRIGHFHATLPQPGHKPSGVETSVHRLATELASSPDDEVTVLSLSPRPPGATYEHRLLFGGRPWLASSVARLALVPALLNTVPLESFDVVHLHGDDWFLFRRPVPTVRTFHGTARWEARSATSVTRRARQTLLVPLERLAGRLATTTAALSADSGGPPNDVLLSPGVDPTLFRPGPKHDRPAVLFVGTWDGRKRGRQVFDWFTGPLLGRVPDAELWMVSDHCRAHPRVHHHPSPTDDELADLARRAWVQVMPSLYEGFGLPILEALASGTAVVASPSPGPRYLLEEGRWGRLVDDADFPDTVATLLADEPTRAAMAAAGQARAAEFTWAAVADRHRAVYRSLLQS
jgi:glycosyltransferase involved in cell wall biosynthesis